MPKVDKHLQQKHISQTRLGPVVNIGASPYERNSGVSAGSSGPLGGGSVYDGLKSNVRFNAGVGNPRTDIKLISFQFGPGESTVIHSGKGRGLGYDQFNGKRSMATSIYELGNIGNNTWECYSGGLAINSLIKPDGVSIRNGVNGLDSITIESSSPGYSLGQLELPQLPYMLFKMAHDEQLEWLNLANQPTDQIQNTLGYPLRGAGQGGIADNQYSEPFPAFGAYIDLYTATLGSLGTLPGPNPRHFPVRLSASRAFSELFANHLNATVGGGVYRPQVQPLHKVFGVDIQGWLDVEQDLMHFELSGSINSMIQTVAQQGMWRAWWDAECNFHFIPDYFGPNDDPYSKPMAEFHYGPSLIGELEINPGTNAERVNRVAVKPQQFMGFGDNTDDILTSYANRPLGAVYPPGKQAGGNDRNMDNYAGKRADIQAKKMFYKETAMTTFTLSNFPNPMAAIQLFNRVISITGEDPRKGWKCDGKRFIVTNVSGQLDDPERPDGGNGYLCTLSGIEVDSDVDVKIGTFIGAGAG